MKILDKKLEETMYIEKDENCIRISYINPCCYGHGVLQTIEFTQEEARKFIKKFKEVLSTFDSDEEDDE